MLMYSYTYICRVTRIYICIYIYRGCIYVHIYGFQFEDSLCGVDYLLLLQCG